MSEGKPGNRAPIWILVAVGGCGCLVLLTGVLGILAAIVIPNFIDASEKAKQKRTVSDLRSAGTAWLSWMVDHEDEAARLTSGALAADRLEALLVPEYISALAATDGWGHALEFRILDSGAPGFPSLEIQSPGRDGVFETPPDIEEEFPAYDYDRDIVWRDGLFLLYPGAVSAPASAPP